MKHTLKLSLFLLCMIHASLAWSFTIPHLESPINDYAHILTNKSKVQALSDRIRAIHKAGKAQIAVLIVKSLEGQAISSYSIAVVDKWKLGHKNNSNGLLFIMAIEDRKMRIEVGRDLEGTITDLYSHRIIDSLVPLLKNKEYENAIESVVNQIESKIDNELLVSKNVVHKQTEVPAQTSDIRWKNLFLILTGIATVVFSLASYSTYSQIKENNQKDENNKKHFSDLGADLSQYSHQDLSTFNKCFHNKLWLSVKEYHTMIMSTKSDIRLLDSYKQKIADFQAIIEKDKQAELEWDNSEAKKLSNLNQSMIHLEDKKQALVKNKTEFIKNKDYSLVSSDLEYTDLLKESEGRK